MKHSYGSTNIFEESRASKERRWNRGMGDGLGEGRRGAEWWGKLWVRQDKLWRCGWVIMRGLEECNKSKLLKFSGFIVITGKEHSKICLPLKQKQQQQSDGWLKSEFFQPKILPAIFTEMKMFNGRWVIFLDNSLLVDEKMKIYFKFSSSGNNNWWEV